MPICETGKSAIARWHPIHLRWADG